MESVCKGTYIVICILCILHTGFFFLVLTTYFIGWIYLDIEKHVARCKNDLFDEFERLHYKQLDSLYIILNCLSTSSEKKKLKKCLSACT